MTPLEYEELNRFAPGWSMDGSDDFVDDNDADDEEVEEQTKLPEAA